MATPQDWRAASAALTPQQREILHSALRLVASAASQPAGNQMAAAAPSPRPPQPAHGMGYPTAPAASYPSAREVPADSYSSAPSYPGAHAYADRSGRMPFGGGSHGYAPFNGNTRRASQGLQAASAASVRSSPTPSLTPSLTMGSELDPLQTLTDEDYEFLSSLQLPPDTPSLGGPPTAAAAVTPDYRDVLAAGGSSFGRASPAAVSFNGNGVYGSASEPASGPGASFGRVSPAAAAVRGFGAGAFMEPTARSATASGPGGAGGRLGLNSVFEPVPWLQATQVQSSGQSMGQQSHSAAAQAPQQNFSHFLLGEDGLLRGPPSMSSEQSPSSASVPGAPSEAGSFTARGGFAGSLGGGSIAGGGSQLHSALLGDFRTSMDGLDSLGGSATGSSGESPASNTSLPPPAGAAQDNHLWAGLDTDEKAVVDGIASWSGPLTLPPMPVGDLPDLDQQPDEWLFTDPQDWADLDDLAALDTAEEWTAGGPSTATALPAATAKKEDSLSAAASAAFPSAWSSGAGAAVSSGGAGRMQQESDEADDADDDEESRTGGTADGSGSAADRHRAGRQGGGGASGGSASGVRPKRVRSRKRRLASDLPPEELAKMREVNRNAAKRHRAMARSRVRVQQMEFKQAEAQLTRTRAELHDLSLQRDTLQRLVLELYGPGGARAMAFLQSGSNASFLGI